MGGVDGMGNVFPVADTGRIPVRNTVGPVTQTKIGCFYGGIGHGRVVGRDSPGDIQRSVCSRIEDLDQGVGAITDI